MKNIILMVFFAFIGIGTKAQEQPSKTTQAKVISNKVVEIACGECKFKMKGHGCDLAVRIDGKPYFVQGKDIDSFGDAHAKTGFCKAISKAKVSGEIVNNQFKASSITLLPSTKK